MAKKLDPSVTLGSSNNESEVPTTATTTATKTTTKEKQICAGLEDVFLWKCAQFALRKISQFQSCFFSFQNNFFLSSLRLGYLELPGLFPFFIQI